MQNTKHNIDEQTLQNLLYLSRLSPESTNLDILGTQVRQIVEYFEIISKYADTTSQGPLQTEKTEDDLRPDSIAPSLEQSDLKKMSPEFMDGYFRVPKVLGGGA